MSDTEHLSWSYDPRVEMHLTGTSTDGAAVGYNSTRLHYCRVVHGDRAGDWDYYESTEDAMRAAEIVLVQLREPVEEKVVGPPISEANPW